MGGGVPAVTRVLGYLVLGTPGNQLPGRYLLAGTRYVRGDEC